MSNIYVKVKQFKGKSGGFATTLRDRWSVILMNESKQQEIRLDNFMCGGYGYASKDPAMELAERYAELLELPIVETTGGES